MTLEQRLQTYLGKTPQVHPTAYVHPSAVLIGDVRLGPHVTVLPHAVLRADFNFIEVGAYTNIQDGCVLHLSNDHPVRLGAWVTIGHAAVVHACTVEDGSLIGMHATVLDGAVIGRESIVGANALVTKGTIVPARSLVLGAPAKVVRSLTENEITQIRGYAEKYVAAGQAYAALQ